MSSDLVSVDWLKEHLDDDSLVILDASMSKVIGIEPILYAELCVIPGAIKCDIESYFADVNGTSPHTLPQANNFAKLAADIGLSSEKTLVIYDNQGIYSAPRAWFLFRLMGYQRVYVLDGGLIKWQEAGYQTVSVYQSLPIEKVEVINQIPCVQNRFDILSSLNKTNYQVVDVRAENRFYAKVPEPRDGVRSGHIPGASNLPFQQCLCDRQYKPLPALKQLFEQNNLTEAQHLVFSCGSGVTACIVLFAAIQLGFDKVSLYDGSWAEWGADHSLPIDTGGI